MLSKKLKKRPTLLALAILLLCAVILSGCSKDESGNVLRQGLYFMIKTQTEEYPQPEAYKTGWIPLGKQFHNDEAIQIWGELKKVDEETVLNLYLIQEDGSDELLLYEISRDYSKGSFYLDQNRDLYFLGSEELTKLDKNGNIIFRHTGKVSDICQMPDGRIMLLIPGENNSKFAELNVETGIITEKDIPLEGFGYYLGCDANGPVLLNTKGFWTVNLSDGSLTPLIDFYTLSYELKGMVQDFRLPEKNEAELIKYDIRENLQIIDISTSRKIVIFRDWTIDSTIRTCAYNFNQQNEEYYVVLEECDEGMDITDFRSRTGIELVTDKGADIITSDAISDVWGYIQNGALEDLTPYIKNSGLQKDDFFPATFGHWTSDGKIYGVDLRINPTAIWMDEELLGGRDVPNVETLVTAMLNYQGDKKWLWDSSWILSYLLRGSENMWGLIDREQGSCDFTGEFFVNMLNAAKLHGGTYKRDNISADWAETGFGFLDSQEKLASEGKVYVGFLFDDGAHALANEYGTLAINSSSPNKDGAWAFINYLLDDEVQKAACGTSGLVNGSRFPASKTAFNAARSYLEKEITSHRMTFTSGGVTASNEDILDPDRQAEIRTILEDARFAPINNGDILGIILEEAEPYFSGSKSAEEVCNIIQNRVKLYLDEKH